MGHSNLRIVQSNAKSLIQSCFSIKKQSLLFLALLIVTSGKTQINTTIDSIINLITIESYSSHFDSLKTGPGCSRKVIQSEKQSIDHNQCRDHIYAAFQNYFGTQNAHRHFFNAGKYEGLCNVIGFKKGKIESAGIWIISAHYDTNNNLEWNHNSSTPAPGANDNGTGLAALLEIARVLSNIETNPSILFAAWDMEERFTNEMPTGSNTWYLDHITKQNDTEWEKIHAGGLINHKDIIGNINFDMFGNPQHMENNQPVLWACYAKKNQSHFTEKYAETINKYIPAIHTMSYGRLIWSDHYTFASRNHLSVVNLESGYMNDPFYHKPSDHYKNPSNINFDFATKVTQGGLAFLLEEIFNLSPQYFISLNRYPRKIWETHQGYYFSNNTNNTIFIMNAFGKTTKFNQHAYSPSHSGIYYIRDHSNKQISGGTILLKKKEGLTHWAIPQ